MHAQLRVMKEYACGLNASNLYLRAFCHAPNLLVMMTAPLKFWRFGILLLVESSL